MGAVWALSVALEGWAFGPVAPVRRVLMGIGALALMYPPLLSAVGVSGFVLNAAGAAGLAVFYMVRTRSLRERRAQREGAP